MIQAKWWLALATLAVIVGGAWAEESPKSCSEGEHKLSFLEPPSRNTPPKEGEIRQKLLNPVDLNYKDVPLKQVIDSLASLSEINIVPDIALEEANIDLNVPLSLRVEGISLMSGAELAVEASKPIFCADSGTRS